ncbi:hypothetical protein [Cesiribacter sp. SM1]|uniref:hypothetical protein n=1 Tax=Cesiribacter sp. SM1 TaxID=2861196 RepID=UPI001CD6B294|nr:hypothetical protein [Cesiribacter sp. SM1]
MKKSVYLPLILLLLVAMSCQKSDDSVAPVSEQKKMLMAVNWTIDKVIASTDYTMTTSVGSTPVKQSQVMEGLSDECEYAATMQFARDEKVVIGYAANFCGLENPAANNVKWRSDDAVSELTLIGENLAGFSVNIQGDHMSNGNEATFKVKELSPQKLTIERSIPISSFFSEDVLALYASQGITMQGTYTYTTTYIAR